MRAVLRFVGNNTIGLLALVVALGGTSYAVTLAKGSVKSQHIAASAVKSKHVKDGSLLAKDFKKGQLPAGPTGPAGPAGRSALSELQPGETVRGYISGDYETHAASGDWRAGTSFAIPGSTPPAQVYVDDVTPGETCTGSVGAPTAPSGTLCVYLLEVGNPNQSSSSHVVVNQTQFGFQVSWSPTGVGDTYLTATYAYTQG